MTRLGLLGSAAVIAGLAKAGIGTPMAVAKGHPRYTSPGYRPVRIPRSKGVHGRITVTAIGMDGRHGRTASTRLR